MVQSKFIILTPPDKIKVVQGLGQGHILAHQAYRMGGGPHLFRASHPLPIRGGYMVIDSTGFDGRGESTPFCQQVLRECQARQFKGVVCQFQGAPIPLLGKITMELSTLLTNRGMPLYVMEGYGKYRGNGKVLLSTALSGGTLQGRLQEGLNQYGADGVAILLECVAEDFFLPSPTGRGIPLTQETLKERISERNPAIFFSGELCAHYFTYMAKDNGAHFILFDDAVSLQKKIQVANSLGISDVVLSYQQMADVHPIL